MVTSIFRPLRDFAPSYFDDIFIHSKAKKNETDVKVHLRHLRRVFELMRENKLYGNLKKCIFFASEIPVLGCFVGKNGVRVDPDKVKAIDDWPAPTNVKQLRQWLGLANYLHKYTRNFAALVQPLTRLLKKDVEWKWTKEHQDVFELSRKAYVKLRSWLCQTIPSPSMSSVMQVTLPSVVRLCNTMTRVMK